MYGIKGEGMLFKGWIASYPKYQRDYHFSNTHPLDAINRMLIRNDFQCIDVGEVDSINFKDWSIPFKYTLVHKTLGEFIFTGSLFYGQYLLTKK